MGVTVEAAGFRVDYPGFTLGPLDFSVGRGERVALVGHNGAGKSTAMRALAGRPTRYGGSLLFDGREIRDSVPDVRARIGLLPERLAAFEWMTVGEHLAFLASVHPMWDADYAEALLARLELPRATRVGTLSRGMMLKLAFISAESFRPALLLLDEPTAGLDPGMREELLQLVLEAAPEESGRAVVFSTHMLEDVHLLADRVLVLRQGDLVADRSLHSLRESSGGVEANRVLRDLMSGRG
jgi:ABC-type multidrug transport system ATPase subunit